MIAHKPIAESGFTLLEAIVALTLLATAGMMLFTWISAGFDSIERIEQANAAAAAELNALEYLKGLNIGAQPAGQTRLGEITMRWQARPVAGPTPNRVNTTEIGQQGPFTLTLYDTEVILEGPALSRRVFTVRQMGWTRATTNDDPFGAGPANPSSAPLRR